MGRPPLPEGETRGVVFTLRLSEAERDVISEAAKRADKPVTQWAREAIVSVAKTPIETHN